MFNLDKYGLKPGTPIPDNLQVPLRTSEDGRAFAAFNKAQIKLANALTKTKGALDAKINAYRKNSGHALEHLTDHQKQVFYRLIRACAKAPQDQTKYPTRIEMDLTPEKLLESNNPPTKRVPKNNLDSRQLIEKRVPAEDLQKSKMVLVPKTVEIDEEAIKHLIWTEKSSCFDHETHDLKSFYKEQRDKIVSRYGDYKHDIERHRTILDKRRNNMPTVGDIIQQNLKKQLEEVKANKRLRVVADMEALPDASASLKEPDDRSEIRVRKKPVQKSKPDLNAETASEKKLITEQPKNLITLDSENDKIAAKQAALRTIEERFDQRKVEFLATLHHPEGIEVAAKMAALNAEETEALRNLVAQKKIIEVPKENPPVLDTKNNLKPLPENLSVKPKQPPGILPSDDYLPKYNSETNRVGGSETFALHEKTLPASFHFGHAINLARFGSSLYSVYNAKTGNDARSAYRDLMITGVATLPTFLSRHSEISASLATPAALLSSLMTIGFAAHDAGAKNGRRFAFDKTVAAVTGGTAGGWLLSSAVNASYAMLLRKRSGIVKEGIGLALGIAAYTLGDKIAADQAEQLYDNSTKKTS